MSHQAQRNQSLPRPRSSSERVKLMANTKDGRKDSLASIPDEDPILDESMRNRLNTMSGAASSPAPSATRPASTPPALSQSKPAMTTGARWAAAGVTLIALFLLIFRLFMSSPPEEPPPVTSPLLLTSVVISVAVGTVLGVVGSLPIAGPASVNVLKTGMEGRIGTARALAVGAGLGEGMWAGIAFSGFYHLTSFIEQYAATFQIIGSVILCGVGASLLLSSNKSSTDSKDPDDTDSKSSHDSSGLILGLSLTALNPALLATYTGALSSLYPHVGASLVFGPASAAAFGAGVAFGVAGWFNVLVSLLQYFKARLRPYIQLVCKVFGTLLCVLGLVASRPLWGALYNQLVVGS